MSGQARSQKARWRDSPWFQWGLWALLAVVFVIQGLTDKGWSRTLAWFLLAYVVVAVVLGVIGGRRHPKRPDHGFWKAFWLPPLFGRG